MKQFQTWMAILEHYLADKRHIAVGQHYKIEELRSLKDFVGGQVRTTGATLRYHIGQDRYRVELYKENNGYYQCIEVQKMGTKVDGLIS